MLLILTIKFRAKTVCVDNVEHLSNLTLKNENKINNNYAGHIVI